MAIMCARRSKRGGSDWRIMLDSVETLPDLESVQEISPDSMHHQCLTERK